MTLTDLQITYRRLSLTGRSYLIPLVTSLFIQEIIRYSKSRELAKRSCDKLLKKGEGKYALSHSKS